VGFLSLSDQELPADLQHTASLKLWSMFGLMAPMLVALLVAVVAPARVAWWAAAVALTLKLIEIGTSIVFSRQALDGIGAQTEMYENARRSTEQVEELFAMTDMLQAAEDHDDAGAVLMATAQRLLPECGGVLYVFNNSRDRLDLAKSWNTSDGFHPAQTLLPGNCWALKRGKPHVNDPARQTLCCMHHLGEMATIEVPMIARGSVYGLLVLTLGADDAHDALIGHRRVARALADSMSLALSNIALREKLRTQSLRDPLTGLYNRRYMEDALDRYVSLAERSGTPTSVVMIDLDNFKRLNDENGHAKGDAVLRDVAGQLVAALRPSDVVSRYGGEELMVILPNCSLDDAVLKAELMRARVEALSEPHGAAISASFGVATVPETSTSPMDVIPMADAALYAAKQAGKNCVRTAERRAGRDDQLRLAVA
jgi:diguanylate cyclase (GGDEF)-like protein